MKSNTRPSAYQFFMLTLCIYALVVLTVQAFVPLSAETRKILNYADTTVCFFFFIDFVASTIQARNRWRYLYTWGWIDLASSIPVIRILRWGRIARVTRIFRVMRGVKSTKILASYILERRAEGAFLAATLIAILLVIFCSIAVLAFETSPDSNIKSAEDALWWAVVTVTTVGYGDKYPVTAGGRLIGVLLMTAGVCLFGAFVGLVAAWFLRPTERKEERELDEIRTDIETVKRSIRAIEGKEVHR